MTESTRAHVVISGRVQGVFFRATTQRAAKERGVAGWVRNRSDGTVEAVMEGGRQQVADLIRWCWEGSPGSRVTSVEVREENPVGEFRGFDITG